MGEAALKKDNIETRTQAFENAVLEHLDAMFAVALKLTRNPTDAQDLVQEAVVRALRFHDKFQEGTYMKAWLLTILRNTFINEYRKKARRPILVDVVEVDTVEKPVSDRDMGFYPEALKSKDVLELLDDDIRHAVDALPEGHRHTVIMADLQDMSYKEIAEKLDCPLGTVMSRLHRGRRILRQHLSNGHRFGAAPCPNPS